MKMHEEHFNQTLESLDDIDKFLLVDTYRTHFPMFNVLHNIDFTM